MIKKCTEILELQLEYQKVEKNYWSNGAKDDNCTVSDLVNNLIENRLRREKRHTKEAENKNKGD